MAEEVPGVGETAVADEEDEVVAEDGGGRFHDVLGFEDVGPEALRAGEVVGVYVEGECGVVHVDCGDGVSEIPEEACADFHGGGVLGPDEGGVAEEAEEGFLADWEGAGVGEEGGEHGFEPAALGGGVNDGVGDGGEDPVREGEGVGCNWWGDKRVAFERPTFCNAGFGLIGELGDGEMSVFRRVLITIVYELPSVVYAVHS